MKEIDPKKELIGLVVFDGTWNVQESEEKDSDADAKLDAEPSDMEDNSGDCPIVDEKSWNPSPALRFEMARWWNYYKPKLLSDYIRVASLLFPHPTVTENAKKNRNSKDDNTVDH